MADDLTELTKAERLLADIDARTAETMVQMMETPDEDWTYELALSFARLFYARGFTDCLLASPAERRAFYTDNGYRVPT